MTGKRRIRYSDMIRKISMSDVDGLQSKSLRLDSLRN